MQNAEPTIRSCPETKFWKAMRKCRIIHFLVLSYFENSLDLRMNKEHFISKKDMQYDSFTETTAKSKC